MDSIINNQLDITFETKCYENDWEYILKTRHLDKMIKNCNVNFKFKQLIINNVKEPDKIKEYANKKVREKVIDAYYFVDDYIDEALKFFDISRDSLGVGYYYSSAEFVGLYLSKTKYHLHFASDTFMQKKSNWITDACDILDKQSEYIVANPTWNLDYKFVKKESIGGSIGDFFIGHGFSDQCYLVKTDVFRRQIYNYKHLGSEHYPKYGGELFEKRVNSYMLVNNLYRITSIKASYIHQNFPKSRNKKLVLFLININLYCYFCYIMILKNRTKNILKRILKHG
jgi:hypothetical protein